jgi:hypothetical protein
VPTVVIKKAYLCKINGHERDARASGGGEVNIKVIYEGTNLRPSAFEVRYKIDGKTIEPEIISNKK